MFHSVDAAMVSLARQRYAADRDTATAMFLALELGKPLFVEGAHGTGKTALATALASALGASLIRLRCFEGMDPERAAYSWDYAGQMSRMAAMASMPPSRTASRFDLRAREFVIEGPLLKAISSTSTPPVLLVDDIERAGPAFETFLAEFLERLTLEIPGAGMFRAVVEPRIVIASRAEAPEVLSADAQYLWLDYPDYRREVDIVQAHVPGVGAGLSGEICNLAAAIRAGRFIRKPGIGETIDWARALVALRRSSLDYDAVNETLGCLLRSPADIRRFRREQFYERAWEQRLDVSA